MLMVAHTRVREGENREFDPIELAWGFSPSGTSYESIR
jgi:hypothetical protein